jgi:hypothetical protein
MSSGEPKQELPQDLVEFLAGGRLVVGSTVDAQGAPYTMVMNSAMAYDATRIRFCLDRRTHTLKNIEAGSAMMLEIIGDGMIYGVCGTPRVIREVMEHGPVPSAMIELEVTSVKRDLPPGVQVTAPTFEWGPLGAYIVPIEEKMFEEMRTYVQP